MYYQPYTSTRLRAFQQRKQIVPIRQESNVQAIIAAIILTLAVIVGMQYIQAQRDLTAAQVGYYTTTEQL